MVGWALQIVAAVILTQALVLNLKFQREAKGYLLRAAAWIWPTLGLIVLIESFLATCFVELVSKVMSLKLSLVPALVGVLAVLLPRGFEHLLFDLNFSEEKITGSLARLLRRLNLAAAHEFGGAIRTRIEQDVFDWQTQSDKYFGLTPEDFRRRIRQVYRCHVEEVAMLRRDPGFLFRDVGFSPYGHLYILAAHLGRRRLRKELNKRADQEWPGDEKRRIRLTIAARTKPGKGARFYDDEELIRRIRGGQAKAQKQYEKTSIEHPSG